MWPTPNAPGGCPAPIANPFDRMLAAQALAREFPFVPPDPVFDAFGVIRLWRAHHRAFPP